MSFPWTLENTDPSFVPQPRCIAYSSALGLFAIGGSVSAVPTIITSTDGISWTTVTMPSDPNNCVGIYAIGWSPDLGIFAAIGMNAAQLQFSVFTSPDGVTWTPTSIGTPPSSGLWGVSSMCWSHSLGIFCCSGATFAFGEPFYSMTSSDGASWSFSANLQNVGMTYGGLSGVSWSESLGLFCACMNEQTQPGMCNSSDGLTWNFTPVWDTTGPSLGLDTCWSDTLGLFCAAGGIDNSNPLIAISSDGTSWSLVGSSISGITNQSWGSVCWDDTAAIFMIVGAGPPYNSAPLYIQAASSPDGSTWTAMPTPSNGYGWDAVGSDSGGNFVASNSGVFPNVMGNGSGPPPPTITVGCSSGSATVLTSYDSFVTASGGFPGYTFAISSGSLPPGLSLNTSTGEVLGIPTMGGIFTFQVQATDTQSNVGYSTCGIDVANPTPARYCVGQP